MEDATRTQMLAHLGELRALLHTRGVGQADDPALQAHIAELEALVQGGAPLAGAASSAQSLETRLLAWEAEHPQLTALASRIARALESAGL